MHLAQRLANDRKLIGEAFNFSNEQPMSVLQIVRHLLELMASKLEPDIQGQASCEILAQSLDSTKAKKQLDWTPGFDLELGLQKTIAWYRDFFSN